MSIAPDLSCKWHNRRPLVKNELSKEFMTMHLRRWSLTLCLLMLIIGAGACTGNDATNGASEVESEQTAAVEETATPESQPVAAAGPAEGLPVLEGEATVELQVNGGKIVMELDGSKAPVTAGNFVDLVERGVYDGTVFHRVVKEPEPFVVQGGDPQSTDPSVSPQLYGTGSFTDPETNEPRMIPLEILPAGEAEPIYSQTLEEAGVSASPELTHTRGAVAMARSQPPDSASAQFYIALADLPFLDGGYAVFGYVTEGMDVVDGIEQGDVLESATVTSGLENLKQPE